MRAIAAVIRPRLAHARPASFGRGARAGGEARAPRLGDVRVAWALPAALALTGGALAHSWTQRTLLCEGGHDARQGRPAAAAACDVAGGPGDPGASSGGRRVALVTGSSS
eukprot:CAMPEP_0203953642 /NCGR_PEP_ID=MMETSP0359-20131031/86957_1 /ASSEMBLY_ACC=CAM_ASM_000338 /TAXON_ID=268821 /ORGANISM="Scrippsiella Hangoei, Strain SHTV-5" /LENGTH=109 /DNA_ID=CAMNT_0050887025 /DNA_START=39 /DNA_END=365 /DNA_ORIENTATION=-